MIEAKVICDSISPEGIRLTTMQLRYPKFIHGEFMTHRMFSRNASSSRAIPTARYLEEVRSDELRASPVFWGKNQSGMQAVEEFSDEENAQTCYKNGEPQYTSEKKIVKALWKMAALNAATHAEKLQLQGVHKQIVNRILEPFIHINVLVTATEWVNFYTLRRHKDAQPEMKALADAMYKAQEASEPKKLSLGEWHLPYFDTEHMTDLAEGEDPMLPVKVSVARCARVSYMSYETGKRSEVLEDLKLYERLVGSHPIHASPAEHQATPDQREKITGEWFDPQQHGNFFGWRQYRKMLPNENIT